MRLMRGPALVGGLRDRLSWRNQFLTCPSPYISFCYCGRDYFLLSASSSLYETDICNKLTWIFSMICFITLLSSVTCSESFDDCWSFFFGFTFLVCFMGHSLRQIHSPDDLLVRRRNISLFQYFPFQSVSWQIRISLLHN